jgi:hypothetical protein|tara:strand:- start:2213 stop:3202 length:990 start_codon:yes stop_codon:yes gene_type:complete
MKILKNIISVFLILFVVISCASDDEIIDNSKEVTPGVKLVNFSHTLSSCDPSNDTYNYCSDKINSWTNKGVSKMKNQNADVLVVTWNVGEFVSEGGFDRPYNTHKVVLMSSEIESILSNISEWLKGTCLSSGEQSTTLNEYRNYLEKGADVSSQFVICSNSRIVLAAYKKAKNSEEENGIQSFVLHELYHAFQQDLGIQSCTNQRESSSNSNGKAIVEGAAQLFAEIATGEMKGHDGINNLLKQVYNDYQGSKDKSISNGYAWSAGLALMIQRSWLDQSIIMDGSLFHNCKTETDFTNSNQNLLKIKDLWYMIEKDGDNYKFSDQALGK